MYSNFWHRTDLHWHYFRLQLIFTITAVPCKDLICFRIICHLKAPCGPGN